MQIVRERLVVSTASLLNSLDDVIRWHNEVPQGLSSAMFTTNLISAETFLSHRDSDCGIANINIGTSGGEKARIGQRRMESLPPQADEYAQLVKPTALGAGHRIQILVAVQATLLAGRIGIAGAGGVSCVGPLALNFPL